jgi:hypothetical protein
MATPQNANVVFFPWVRQGAAAAIGTVETLGANLRAAVDLTATLAVNDAPTTPVKVRLRGPADVVGIDPHEIVRSDPRPGSADFEPNYFPAIEFDRSDFPWLFTPAKADATARLRPWLCLVVVRAQDGVVLRSTSESPLPQLEIAAPALPADELPDLAECHLWVHAQVAAAASANPSELSAALGGDPEISLSRLLCPRLLSPVTDYIACVVPTFDIGRKAGLGLPISEGDLTNPNGLTPAWSLSPAPAAVTLPVYYSWRFRTGEGGDFESLVRLLQPRPVPASLGKRPIDISKPGFTLPSSFPLGTTLALEGALKPIKTGASAPLPWPQDVAGPFQSALAEIVNKPGLTQAMDPAADPLLAPPLYGRWHAARTTVVPGGTPWFDELNLDPRHRSVAAFGTRVIQEHQEALMASAWEQAADLQRANQRVRQLQLSLYVSTAIHTRHFKALDDEAVLRVAAPAFARLRSVAANTLQAQTLVADLSSSALPVRAASAPMRRIGRVRGPITRRAATQGITRASMPTWLARLNTGSAVFVAQPRMDLANFESLRQHLPQPSSVQPYASVTASAVAGMRGRPTFQIAAEGQPVTVPPVVNVPPTADSAAARIFRAAASTHLSRIDPGRTRIVFGPPAPMTLNNVREGVLAQMEPGRALIALARAVVSSGPNATAPTRPPAPGALPIDTIMAAPKFPQPMYEPLRDLSQQLLLPGLEQVLPNTVLGLQTNRRFVEAYMVGLNFEMGRELLWRGFPTDQRATCFDQFWDPRGALSPRPDVEPLHQWGAAPLGNAQGPSSGEQFVMLMRSDLLRRYPNAAIYAVKAKIANRVRTPSTDAGDEVHPAFRGSMTPDVSFFGFDLTVAAVLGDGTTPNAGPPSNAGYYIVIQEQPSEPRFGLEVGTVAAGGSTHLKASAGVPPGVPLGGLVWGRNSSHMAGILRQQPVRVAIHASQFVTAAASEEPA